MQMIQPVPDKPAWAQFAEFLRRARVEAGLTHRDLSERCGASVDLIRRWESQDVKEHAVPGGRAMARLKGTLRKLYGAQMLWQAALRESTADDEEIEVERKDSVSIAEIATATPVQVQGGDEPPPSLPTVRDQATFGAALRTARLNLGLTQEELGDLLDVHGTAISGWENARNAPVGANWRKIVDALPEMRDALPPNVREIPVPGGRQPYGPKLVPPGVPMSSPQTTATSHGSSGGTFLSGGGGFNESSRREQSLPSIPASVEELGVAYARAQLRMVRAQAKLAELEKSLQPAREELRQAQDDAIAVSKELHNAIAKAAGGGS